MSCTCAQNRKFVYTCTVICIIASLFSIDQLPYLCLIPEVLTCNYDYQVILTGGAEFNNKF